MLYIYFSWLLSACSAKSSTTRIKGSPIINPSCILIRRSCLNKTVLRELVQLLFFSRDEHCCFSTNRTKLSTHWECIITFKIRSQYQYLTKSHSQSAAKFCLAFRIYHIIIFFIYFVKQIEFTTTSLLKMRKWAYRQIFLSVLYLCWLFSSMRSWAF